MKSGRRPTRKQKTEIKANGLNYENWLVVKNTTEVLEIVHKHSGNIRRIQRKQV